MFIFALKIVHGVPCHPVFCLQKCTWHCRLWVCCCFDELKSFQATVSAVVLWRDNWGGITWGTTTYFVTYWNLSSLYRSFCYGCYSYSLGGCGCYNHRTREPQLQSL